MRSGRALIVEKEHGDSSMSAMLPQLLRVSESTKRSPMSIALDYARSARGEGRLSPQDYIDLRLFDEEMYKGAQKGTFVGKRRNRDLCYEINYRRDWLGVPENKLLSIGYLGMFGLPVIAPKAIYAPFAQNGSAHLLRDRTALERFLTDGSVYPLFCKPAESAGSLGSIALAHAAAHSRELEKLDGTKIAIDALVSDIEKQYAAGYVFQSLQTPEPSIGKLTAGRIATVRFVTIAVENGPELFRAVWKIPARDNAADNYWRAGNLLAKVDLDTGRIERVTSGAGLQMTEHEVHPDTGERLVGFVHPRWQEMKALALEGARVMRTIPLLGWDIACTDHGPLVVEMNENPDFFLMQFADRRGMLDERFKRFIAHQKKERDAFQSEMSRRAALL